MCRLLLLSATACVFFRYVISYKYISAFYIETEDLFMLDSIYNQIYFLGVQTIRYGKRFFRWIGSLLMKPVKAVATLFFTLIIVVDKFALKVFHEIVNDYKELISEIKRVYSSMIYINGKGKKRWSLKQLGRYLRVAFRRYKRAFVYVFNIVLPIASLVILLNVVGLWSNTTFALELSYDGEIIGYVRTEAEYKQAREMAIERLDTFYDDSASNEAIKQAEYEIKPVKLNRINDARTICDKLIEESDYDITNACGIYIDGAFLCAVKNETDAVSVFDSILAEYETGEANATVSFVEDIEYVQGLYPDSEGVIRDASYLSDKLNSKKSEASYYTVESGDSIVRIAQKLGLTTTEIFNLNPQLKGENIYVGQQILVASEVNFVRVQTTKTEVREAEIDYDTVKINTDRLYVGDSKVVVKGVKGVDEVTELVTYIDGVKVSTKEVSRKTVKEPVDEKIQVGTKKNYYNSGGGNPYGGTLAWPAVGATSVSSGYGYRSLNGWHGGIDLVRPGGSMGCTVVAAESGVVTFAGWYGSGGNTIIIDHGNGISTLYAHMKTGSLKVVSGQRVTRGQAIGNIGDTGYVTGPHLHFEVRVNGTKVNPAPYLGIK